MSYYRMLDLFTEVALPLTLVVYYFTQIMLIILGDLSK